MSRHLVYFLSKLMTSCLLDLVNMKAAYPKAIDILISHLHENYHDRNKEGIIRALAVKEAKGKANAELLKEYYSLSKEKDSLRWAIGLCFFNIIRREDVSNILGIVRNKANGKSRQMFVASLGKIKSEEVEEVLINVLDDDVVASFALDALGRLKSKKAKSKILEMMIDLKGDVRKEAEIALRKIG